MLKVVPEVCAHCMTPVKGPRGGKTPAGLTIAHMTSAASSLSPLCSEECIVGMAANCALRDEQYTSVCRVLSAELGVTFAYTGRGICESFVIEADVVLWDPEMVVPAACVLCAKTCSLPMYRTKVGKYYFPDQETRLDDTSRARPPKPPRCACSHEHALHTCIGDYLRTRRYSLWSKLPGPAWLCDSPFGCGATLP